MEIVFTNKVPENVDKPFGIYRYDEMIAQNLNYIDIRAIVQSNCWVWLDEIQQSHCKVSKAFLGFSRWWWVTFMSRLDARPWGHEPLLKPLLYAKAVVEWITLNQNIDSIFLVGCDPLVSVYLKEFEKTLILGSHIRSHFGLVGLFHAFRQSFVAFLKMFKIACNITWYHLCNINNKIDFKVIVLNETVPGRQITKGAKYFYTSLFDTIDDKQNSIGFACSSHIGSGIARAGSIGIAGNSTFFLMDNINFLNLIRSVLINISIIFVTFSFVFRKMPCDISDSVSYVFWKNYLFHELGRVPCLNEICNYWNLRKLFSKSKCELILYPYEEKGLERAYLFACQEQNIHSIGYTPHPQHRLALALRNTFDPVSPKPGAYAVCGPAYIDFFVRWGGKDRNSMMIWGSGKSFNGSVAHLGFKRSHLVVLVLISHPNELSIFYSWLKSEKRLSDQITYIVRVWMPGYSEFKETLSILMKEFDCIKISQWSLDEDLSQCDLAVFCGTSAGPVAINQGYLAIYIDLNDFFPINPCFDDLQKMLPCYSPSDLADRLDEICTMDADSLEELHNKQVYFVKTIFSSIRTSVVREDILC